LGKQAGVAISPDTRINTLRDVVASVELILVMSVYPGRSGQKFLDKSIARLEEVRKLVANENSKAVIGIDGGITPDTVARAVDSGASNLVAATAIFHGEGTVKANISVLRQAALQSR
jgi:ribulose-phosphate 3-epimerase